MGLVDQLMWSRKKGPKNGVVFGIFIFGSGSTMIDPPHECLVKSSFNFPVRQLELEKARPNNRDLI